MDGMRDDLWVETRFETQKPLKTMTVLSGFVLNNGSKNRAFISYVVLFQPMFGLSIVFHL